MIEEPISPADIIVIATSSFGAGALQAADLIHSGVSTQVAVFTDPPSGEDLEFIRRGLPYEDEAATQIRQLRWLGVTDIQQIPRTEAGTNDEVLALARWCDQHKFRSVVFVVANHHSRRTRRVVNRLMNGHLTKITVRPYPIFDPDRWWETRRGIEIGIVELQKLVLDFILHPI